MTEAAVEPSMAVKDDNPVSALAATKIRCGPWRTGEAVERSTLEWGQVPLR
jgi:hypothetical protein